MLCENAQLYVEANARCCCSWALYESIHRDLCDLLIFALAVGRFFKMDQAHSTSQNRAGDDAVLLNSEQPLQSTDADDAVILSCQAAEELPLDDPVGNQQSSPMEAYITSSASANAPGRMLRPLEPGGRLDSSITPVTELDPDRHFLKLEVQDKLGENCRETFVFLANYGALGYFAVVWLLQRDAGWDEHGFPTSCRPDDVTNYTVVPCVEEPLYEAEP